MTEALPPPEEPARARSPLLGRELAALIERALNREIAASTAAADVLAELEGSSFAVDVLGLGLCCVLRAEPARVVVEFGDASAESGPDRPAATLRATPLDLLKLARAADLSSLKGTRAEIVGSPEIAERFAALLKHARPDVEDALARFVGDVPAHMLARGARGFVGWLGRAGAALRMNTAEFLQEESRALPAALEAEAFYADVEKVRDGVERAAARLARLERAAGESGAKRA